MQVKMWTKRLFGGASTGGIVYSDDMNSVARPLYVISDAHLGAGDPRAERTKSDRLLRFWEMVEHQDGDLVILGDLFDFWFEYKNAIPRFHFEHLMAIRRLVEQGRKVWYVAGNHDFWAGPFLQEELGVTYCPDELQITVHGKTIGLAHGDGWPPAERGYRLMKRVFRNRVAIALFRLIPPDIGFPLARWVSGKSRERSYLPDHVIETYRKICEQRLTGGLDVLIIGHLHAAIHTRTAVGEWLSLGDWIQHFTYGLVDRDGVRLMQWRDDGDHVLIEPKIATELHLEPQAPR